MAILRHKANDSARGQQRAKKPRQISVLAVILACAAVVFLILLNTVIIPLRQYDQAVSWMADGAYDKALAAFGALGSFKDSAEKITECEAAMTERSYQEALVLLQEQQYEAALLMFEALGGYKDSTAQLEVAKKGIRYHEALSLLEDPSPGAVEQARQILTELGDFGDSRELLSKFQYKLSSIVDRGSKYTYRTAYTYSSSGMLAGWQKEHDGVIIAGGTYGANGQLTQETGSDDWDITTYSYHENGALAGVRRALSRNSSTGEVNYGIAEHDSHGNITKITFSDSGTFWTFRYTYTQDGTAAAVECSLHMGKTVKTKTFDLHKSNLVPYNTAPDSRMYFAQFSEDGRRMTLYRLFNDSTEGLSVGKAEETEYDAQGNAVKHTTWNIYGKRTSQTTYDNTYDDSGYLTQVISQIVYDVGASLSRTLTYTYSYIYAPDAE